MSQAIDKLGVLVRVRSRERDRREQAFIARRRDHERCEAQLARQRQELDFAEQRHQAAMRLRASSPADVLLHEYLITQRCEIEALAHTEQEAREAVRQSSHDLAEARTDHHRAQVRLDVLEGQLGAARRSEVRRVARKNDSAQADAAPVGTGTGRGTP